MEQIKVKCSYCGRKFNPQSNICKDDPDYVICPICKQKMRFRPTIPLKPISFEFKGGFLQNHRELPQTFKYNKKQGV